MSKKKNPNLKPSEIRYSQDSISNYFKDETTLIGKTLDDICEERCRISDIPRISVKKISDNWVTADNRRLWVFKHVERLGKCTEIPVLKAKKFPRSKKTSNNHGTSIKIRGGGNPGGMWYLKEPTPQPPYPSTSNIYSVKAQYDLHEEAQSKANMFVQNVGHSTNFRSVGLTDARISPLTPYFPTRLSPTQDMNLDTKSSRYHRYESKTNETNQVQLERPVMVKETVNKFEKQLDQRDNDLTNGLNMSHSQQIVSRVLKKPRNKATEPMSVDDTARTLLREKSTESNHFGMQPLKVRSIRQQTENERGHLAEEHEKASSNVHVKDLSANEVIRNNRSFEYDYNRNESRNGIAGRHMIHSNDKTAKVNLTNQQTETNDGHTLTPKDTPKKVQNSTTKSVASKEKTRLVDDTLRDLSLHVRDIHTDGKRNDSQQSEINDGHKLNPREASKNVPRHTTALQKSITKSVASKENTNLVDTPLRDLNLKIKQRDDERQYDLNEKPQPVGTLFEQTVGQRIQVMKRSSKDNLVSHQIIKNDRHTLKPKAIQTKASLHTTVIQSITSDGVDTKENTKHVNTPSRDLNLRDIHIDVKRTGSQQTEANDRHKLNPKEAFTKVLRHTTAIQKSTTKSMASKLHTHLVDTPTRDLSLGDIHIYDERNDRYHQQGVETLGRMSPSDRDSPAAYKPKREKTMYLDLKPSEIMFTQATIGSHYIDGIRRIGDVLDDVCERRRPLSDIPKISVRKVVDGHWVTPNNHRLWIFKHVERLGKCTVIRVKETRYNNSGELNSPNHGNSVKIRGGDPGGSWYLK